MTLWESEHTLRESQLCDVVDFLMIHEQLACRLRLIIISTLSQHVCWSRGEQGKEKKLGTNRD